MQPPQQWIEYIYEAGAMPQYWGRMLDHIAQQMAAMGANFIVQSPTGLNITPSPGVEQICHDFMEDGWNHNNSRVSRLLARADYPGFLADADLHSPEELATLPVYRDFLRPLGADAGAATVISGADHDAIVIAFEGFTSHPASQKAARYLDNLRPHLARAASLSSRVQQSRTQDLLHAFNATQSSVAILNKRGKLLGVSDAFQPYLDDMFLDSAARMHIRDQKADRLFTQLLEQPNMPLHGASIAIRDEDDAGVAALHLVPARRQAQDLFQQISYFALLALPNSHSLPSADFLSSLFDLTPAEARIARAVAAGQSPKNLRQDLNITQETVKTHLKRIYAKTATHRQSELILLIKGLG